MANELIETLSKLDEHDANLVEARARELEGDDVKKRIRSARKFTRRLADIRPPEALDPEGFLPLIDDRAGAVAFTEVLVRHAEELVNRPLFVVDAVGRRHSEEHAFAHQAQIAELLIAGVSAFALTGNSDPIALEALMNIAFGADRLNSLVRGALVPDSGPFLHPMGPEPVPLPHEAQEIFRKACMAGVSNALGKYRELLHQAANRATYTIDAQGITALVPSRGRPDDVVVIQGAGFGVTQPAGTTVLFPMHGGRGWATAEVRNWSDAEITVIVPMSVGSGTVGFARKDPPDAPEVSDAELAEAAHAMAAALEMCVGPGTTEVGDRLRGLHPAEPGAGPDALPNGENHFTGGPEITRLSRTEARGGDAVVVDGVLFSPTDQVLVGRTACPTTFLHESQLSFDVADLVEGGDQAVLVRTATGRWSNYIILRVHPVLRSFDPPVAPGGAPPVVRPGQGITLIGSGFAPDCHVRLKTEDSEPRFLNAATIESTVAWPASLPFDIEDTTVDVRVVLRDGDESNALRLTLDTYRIVVLGDSIAWGQGLRHEQKFSSLVANRARELIRGRTAVYHHDVAAHSGATIRQSGAAAAASGEVPSSSPSIGEQVDAWAGEGESVDLVLLTGGINDIGVSFILAPTTLVRDLKDLCRYRCHDDMKALLTKALAEFPNARIVVLGYYQIVSQESDLDLLGVMLWYLYLYPILGPRVVEWAKTRMRENSRIFYEESTTHLRAAVDELNNPRLHFVNPGFGPSNAIFASNSLLFGLRAYDPPPFTAVVPDDPVADERWAACAGSAEQRWCELASVGHPNEAGARAYFRAIEPLLNYIY